MKAVLIAGISSGVGKTSITIALMNFFKKRGYNVAPFKVGPDYIDPKFHKFVTGNNSYNLDSWMVDKKCLKKLFYKNSKGKDIAVIEGVMGFYDGAGISDIGSSAYLAKILDIPVILVVDVRAISRSIAALINGFVNFDKKVNIKGIVCNRVKNDSHYNLIKKIIEKETKVECCGYLKEDEKLDLKSRHLGLIPVEELKDIEEKINYLSIKAETELDLDKIEKIAGLYKNIKCKDNINFLKLSKKLRIGIALDKAFNFYYHDNLDLLREVGVELVTFSPLDDKNLPENINGLYIGGGFPEEFAVQLSKNKSLLKEVKDKLNVGMPAYAECGGLMYLTDAIIKDSKEYCMTGFFKAKARMTKNLQRFGYVEVEYEGVKIKAHEFHHSILEDIDGDDFKYKYQVKKGSKELEWKCGLFKKNVLAGYPHIHFYSNLDFFYKILGLFNEKKK